MKKLISLIIALAMTLAMVACGSDPTLTIPMGTNPDGEVRQETICEEVAEPVYLLITTLEGDVLLETTVCHLDMEEAIEKAILVEMETGETVNVLIMCNDCGYGAQFDAGVPWALLFMCECNPTNYYALVFGNEEAFQQATSKDL